jgi:hypothetical protein
VRRRAPEVTAPGVLPTEFAIGACIEVWAEEVPAQAGTHPVFPINAHGRYLRAFRAWADKAGISQGRDRFALRPGSAPWSIEYLTEQGRSRDVAERLARAGTTTSDIPRLRRTAQAWIDSSRGHA